MSTLSVRGCFISLCLGLSFFSSSILAGSCSMSVEGFVPARTDFSLQNFSVHSVFNGIGAREIANEVVADFVLNSNELSQNRVTLISKNDGVLKNDSAPNEKVDYFVSVNDLTTQASVEKVKLTKSGVDVSVGSSIDGVVDHRYALAVSIPKQAVAMNDSSDLIILQLANL